MFFTLTTKTHYLDQVWVKTFKSKEDAIKWLINSISHAEDDLYREFKLTNNIKAKPGCSFLDTYYFEEGDFNIPIKDFFKELKNSSKKNKEDLGLMIENINTLFSNHHTERIHLLKYDEISEKDYEDMAEDVKQELMKSIHHSYFTPFKKRSKNNTR